MSIGGEFNPESYAYAAPVTFRDPTKENKDKPKSLSDYLDSIRMGPLPFEQAFDFSNPADFYEKMFALYGNNTPGSTNPSAPGQNTALSPTSANVPQNRSVSAPSSGIESQYSPLIEAKAAKYNLDPNFVKALVKAESEFDANKQTPLHWKRGSKDLAMGLGQLTQANCDEYGVKNPYNPEENLEGTCRQLADLKKLYNGDMVKVLAAYNAGPGRVKEYADRGGVPPFTETVNYIYKIYNSLGWQQDSRITQQYASLIGQRVHWQA